MKELAIDYAFLLKVQGMLEAPLTPSAPPAKGEPTANGSA